MSERQGSELKPLVDEIMAVLANELTDGFTAEQAEWAQAVMRDYILPYELRFASEDTEDGKRARIQLIIGDLQEALSGKPTPERWRIIQRMFYTASILPLSDEAFDLALERLNTGEKTDRLRAQAHSLRERLAKLVERMRERAPQVYEALAGVISETSLDLSYAAGEVDVMSLRLGAMHSQRRSGVATCPNCGTANPGGSRFCNRCGTALPG